LGAGFFAPRVWMFYAMARVLASVRLNRSKNFSRRMAGSGVALRAMEISRPSEASVWEAWMRAALAEARKGLGLTAPNPPVGAVVARDGVLLGAGWHPRAGEPHAERLALANAARDHGADAARGATVVVTLEPCSTQGRTPPCVEGLIEAGVARVVWGADDPNPAHAGRAAALLEAAGIEVVRGVLEDECRDLIAGFAAAVTEQRPWVIAKWAMSLDGRITRPAGEGQWLSSPESLADVQRLRAECDGILTSGATVRRDLPRLTLRDPHPHDPGGTKPPLWRVVVTRGGGPLPVDAPLFTEEAAHRTAIAVVGGGAAGGAEPFPEIDARVRRVVVPDFLALMHYLATDLGIHRLLVEAGGNLVGSLIDHRLVDEAVVYLCPLVCGGGIPATSGLGSATAREAPRLVNATTTVLGPDIRMRGRIDRISPPRVLRPAIFFDRDGVVNDPGEHYYVTRWEDFRFHDGIFDLLRRCKERGYATVLVTSQRGVGKGLMTREDLDLIHQRMQEELAARGLAFDAIESYTGAAADGPGAKPDPAMIHGAADALGIDLAASWVIGDSPRDIVMGRNAGCRTVKVGAPMPVGEPAATLTFPSPALVPAEWPPG